MSFIFYFRKEKQFINLGYTKFCEFETPGDQNEKNLSFFHFGQSKVLGLKIKMFQVFFLFFFVIKKN